MMHADDLRTILRADPVLWPALIAARTLDLPDWWIVSGAVYNTVWNSLTGRPAGYGIRDIDLMYFDPDTSWEAENQVIRSGAGSFATPPPVEVRNQARVHLWYEKHFGHAIAPLTSCADSILNFASQTHAVGVRLERDDTITICAPFGLDAVFAMEMRANTRNPNRATHAAKAARCKALWPELHVLPWPDGPIVARAGADTDWNAVLALLRRAFAYMDGRIDPPSSLHRLSAGDLAAHPGTCLLAREGAALIGCVFCKPQGDTLYICKLAVDPAQQSRGVGRRLVEQAAAEARAFGQAALVLQTRIELTANHAAFARLGFEKIGETAHTGYDRPTSITMRKSL